MTITIAAMPAYNESHSIADVIQGCKKYVDRVVVVDDGSTDNTVDIAESLGAYVVRHEVNQGYGAALRHCFEAARNLGASSMVIIDSDGQHDPSEIPKLLEPLRDGFDLVIGSRFVNGNGKNVIQARDHKLKFTEVEIHCRYDLEDCSSEHPFIHGPRVLFQLLKDMEYRRPLYYFAVPGLIMTSTGVLMGLKFLQDYILGDYLRFGPTLLMVMLTIIGAFMIFTGIILHAISRMIFINEQIRR
ncbi:dolichyl-phosphate mannose synthase [Methanosarcina mazei]|uniref:Dolichyl-phosphate mannose synthase n=1 Tax=Methanosarcina mazei TaxID=2209 RepID=A0A0F8RML8_METMZ|nr:glycosyltransferase family 2 protein [Methanosarcina mazei]KKH18691.1 dolichyl-phosphate mannose synthase [Methanosarcina mazei]KKH62209.1 dolichyl-phosphate mannose synthase [Methanosarcina mazei]